MLLYMLSSWRMYKMHPALFFKTGCHMLLWIELTEMLQWSGRGTPSVVAR
jgi:hypothetical protein